MVTPPLRTPCFRSISMESCRMNSLEFRDVGCRRSNRAFRAGRKETALGSLVLRRAKTSRLSGQLRDEEANVPERRMIIGRMLKVAIEPAEARRLYQMNESKRHDDQGDLAMVDFPHASFREGQNPTTH